MLRYFSVKKFERLAPEPQVSVCGSNDVTLVTHFNWSNERSCYVSPSSAGVKATQRIFTEEFPYMQFNQIHSECCTQLISLPEEWMENKCWLIILCKCFWKKYVIFKCYQFLPSLLFHLSFTAAFLNPASFLIHLMTPNSAKSQSPIPLNMFEPKCQLSPFAFLLVYCS